MRLNLIIDLLAYNNEIPTNDPADGLKIKNQVEEENVSEITRHFPKIIQNGASDEEISLPDSNTDYLLMFTDQEVSIKLNGSADAIILQPILAGVKTPVMLLRGDITGLTMSNSSGQDANVDITLIKV